MKKIILLIISSLFLVSVIAQNAIQGMKYQAVARDLSGSELINEPIEIRIQLVSGDKISKVYYSEEHYTTTNEFGLFSLNIGEGNVLNGNFKSIPWSEENIWMELSLKEGSQNSYEIISKTKLLAVPYAYYANTAGGLSSNGNGNSNGNGTLNGVPSQNWSLFGNSKSNPDKDKLGTTDIADLVIVTDNTERIRVLSSGEMEVRENAQFDKNVNIDNITKTDYLVVADEVNDTIPNLYPRDGSIVDVRGLFIADSIAIKGGLDIGGNLSVHGDRVQIDKDLYVGRTVHLNTNDQFSPQGETINHGKFRSNGQVTISAFMPNSEDDSNYDNYPLRVQGSDQGMAIKVNGTPDNNNNYISFWVVGNEMKGRIEGQSLTDLKDSFEWWWFNEQKVLNTIFNTLMIAADVTGADDFDAAAVEGLEFLDIISHWVEWNDHLKDNVGVTFVSGSGDYAEWLEKDKLNETFSFGDIVGVEGGKISKKTNNPSNYMVISKSPIVLGNMPLQGKEANYEKVAFMGQVPVKVRGKVDIGDYIIASNSNDGIGIAVNPKAITINQLERIVGVAWSESLSNSSVSLINCAVGINTNDVVIKLKQQHEELNQVKNQMNTILTYLKSKDESFNAELFEIESNEIIAAETNSIVENRYPFDQNRIAERFEKMLSDNPNIIKQIQENARITLDKRGVDYNRYEQTRRLLTDENYLLDLLRDRLE